MFYLLLTYILIKEIGLIEYANIWGFSLSAIYFIAWEEGKYRINMVTFQAKTQQAGSDWSIDNTLTCRSYVNNSDAFSK